MIIVFGGQLHRLCTGRYLPWAVITLVVAMTSSDMFCVYKVSYLPLLSADISCGGSTHDL